MTLTASAQYLQMNWHLCKGILMSVFVRSPHHFLIVVVDLDSGQVLHVGVGTSLWTCPHAHWLLQQWLRTVRELGPRPPNRFCDTIEQAQDRILSWYLCTISTGPLEGVNNKIKILNRRAYGHRGTEFLSLIHI